MIAPILASVSRLICGATVEWRCDPYSDKQRIYFANHSSHLDFVLIWSALPGRLRQMARPVAGRDYWQRGLVRRHLAERVFNAVLVDRADRDLTGRAEAARRTIEHMARQMGDRYSLIVFPEGTRSSDGEIRPFKSGLFYLSRLRPDTELVPVHLENLNRILPKGETLPVPMLSRLVFGPPLPASISGVKEEFLATARAALLHSRVVS
jgi:1-acyl-sn-glycerol-3-phosphate acyltransferase